MPKRWMITQANPQKWLRVGVEDDASYTKEECENWLIGMIESSHSLIQYVKCAHETGAGGLRHLQMFLYLHKDSRKSALIKLLPKAEIRICRSTTATASAYIGNIEFKHADGREKGGSVQYVIEMGRIDDSLLQPGSEKKETSTEVRLLGVKEMIDNGESFGALWNSDFYCLIRYYLPLRTYYRYKHKQTDELGDPLTHPEGVISVKEMDRMRERMEYAEEDSQNVRDYLAATLEANHQKEGGK